MKSTFNKLNAISEKIKKTPWVLGFYAFPIILIFFLINLILGEFLLYKYVISVKNKELEITENTLKFEYDAYQKVLEEWQKIEEKFKEPTVEKYLSPFITEVFTNNTVDLK